MECFPSQKSHRERYPGGESLERTKHMHSISLHLFCLLSGTITSVFNLYQRESINRAAIPPHPPQKKSRSSKYTHTEITTQEEGARPKHRTDKVLGLHRCPFVFPATPCALFDTPDAVAAIAPTPSSLARFCGTDVFLLYCQATARLRIASS